MNDARSQALVTITEGDPLDAALHDVLALTELLALEKHALATQRPDQLVDISARKTDVAQRLESRAGLLRDHLQGDAGNLDHRGERLADLLRSCRRCNTENGVLIGALGRHTRHALALLSGRAHADTVYGPSGQQRLVSASRHSARA